MLCSICGDQEATIHITEVVNSKMIELHLCEECANQKEVEAAAEESGQVLRTLIHMDNPDHKKFRDLTKDWFMPQNLKLVEERVRGIAKNAVDRMLELGDEFDFVNDVGRCRTRI